MAEKPAGFFEGTEMPTAGWWEALWPGPAGVLATVGIEQDMDVIDLCSGDGWFTLQIAVATSGLKLVQVVDVPPYHYGAVFEPPDH